MLKVSATDFQRNFGEYEDRALVEPVSITKHGRERLVVLSKEYFDSLNMRVPKALSVGDLSDADLRKIEHAKVPDQYDDLNDELT